MNITDESIKCIGVKDDCRLYYDGKYNQFFLMTPNGKITRYPRRYCSTIGKWAEKKIEFHKKTLI